MERKQFLGAVFDEIQHHFQLFERERKVYLALAGVAGLCLLTAIVVLAAVRPLEHPAIPIAILGGSGLIAFAAARATAFFHGSIKMVEEVVKRFSKLSEPEMLSTVATLRKRSEVSVLLMGVGITVVLGSVVFATLRVQLMERELDRAADEIATVRNEAIGLKQSVTNTQRAYAALKDSVNEVYPGHVTPDHQVVGVRATAERPAGKPRAGTPPHVFALGLHAAPSLLSSIKRVGYRLRFPNVPEQSLTGEDASGGFRVSYPGEGCLSDVQVTLEMQDGSTDSFSFDQCRSLGWPAVPVAPAVEVPAAD